MHAFAFYVRIHDTEIAYVYTCVVFVNACKSVYLGGTESKRTLIVSARVSYAYVIQYEHVQDINNHRDIT